MRLWRNIKAWFIKVNRRGRDGHRPAERVTEEHRCAHCGEEFVGHYCPQCGLTASWGRYSFKRLVQGFLDIWGMGNRPMMRSLSDLMWRPGHMIRDYLHGHHLAYFPPFKMLAVLIVFLSVACYLCGITDTSFSLDTFELSCKELEKLIKNDFVMQSIRSTGIYLHDNSLVRIIVETVFVVLTAKLIFWRRSPYNLVETFFSQIYIQCQMLILAIVYVLLTRTLYTDALLPYYLPEWIVWPMLFIDFRQLYKLKVWPTMWRTIVFPFVYTIFLVFSMVGLYTLMYIISEHTAAF